MEDVDCFAAAFENGGNGVGWSGELFVEDLRWNEWVVLERGLVRWNGKVQ